MSKLDSTHSSFFKNRAPSTGCKIFAPFDEDLHLKPFVIQAGSFNLNLLLHWFVCFWHRKSHIENTTQVVFDCLNKSMLSKLESNHSSFLERHLPVAKYLPHLTSSIHLTIDSKHLTSIYILKPFIIQSSSVSFHALFFKLGLFNPWYVSNTLWLKERSTITAFLSKCVPLSFPTCSPHTLFESVVAIILTFGLHSWQIQYPI